MDNGASSYRRFLDGDDSGIVEIIRDHKDGLILYLHNFTNNIHTAEDLMEDTFVKLATRKPKFSGRSTFKTWLYAIARNAALDHLRKSRFLKTASMDEVAELAAEEADLERSYLRQEQRILLHRALRGLKPEYRQVLYLTFFEGFSNEEAAKVMGKSRRQVENLVYRAKQTLRSELSKEGYIYEAL